MVLKRISFFKKRFKIKICFVTKLIFEMCYYFIYSIFVIYLRYLIENILRLYLYDIRIFGGK